MIQDVTYRKSFFAAITFHLCLAIALLLDTNSHQRPVMTLEAKNKPSRALPIDQDKPFKDEVVKAVSIDNKEVMETVNRLRQERTNQLQAEKKRQNDLLKQAEMARKARLQEQQRLAQLKKEAETIAIARKKQIEEEKKRLKQLAEQKAKEAKKLKELQAKQEQLQKKQKEETEKLALLKQKQLSEKIKEDSLKAEKIREEQRIAAKAKAELAEKNRQAAIQQAAADAANKAHLAGEINKYKAMILGAIGRQWNVPDNADRHLSSKFKIRLAPDGAVMEVSLMQSSGDPVLDRSAQTAIYKASPLPVPVDPATFEIFRDISLTVRPEDVRG